MLVVWCGMLHLPCGSKLFMSSLMGNISGCDVAQLVKPFSCLLVSGTCTFVE